MEFNILQKVVDFKINEFLLKYYNSMELFENKDVKNNLLHPGEYGTYKESVIMELFEFALPAKYFSGSGFVYNCKKEITSQCDIILYDYQNTPLLSYESENRFYPQEVVYAIGEIKSKLTKKSLCEALIKLANSKDIRKNFIGVTTDGNTAEVNVERNMYDPIFTFLICNEITDFDSNIGYYIQAQYEEAKIPAWQRHNIIVSLANGLIMYKANEECKEILQVQQNIFMPFPHYNGESLDTFILSDTDLNIMKQFVIHINNYLVNTKSFYPEPTLYIV